MIPLRLLINSRLILAFALLVSSAAAEVTRIQIDKREPFADGHNFGRTGAYEIVEGRLFFETDPSSEVNARITDLDLAPTNKSGKVEFWADFFLLKPIDPERGNGCLVYDVHNRGSKLVLWTFNEGERTNQPSTMEHAGNGFLLEQGYSLLWTGWNGDVVEDGEHRLLAGLPIAAAAEGDGPLTGRNYVEISVDEPTKSRPFFWSPWGTSDAYPAASLDNSDATLTMRERRSDPAVQIPSEDWSFARWEDDKLIPDATSLYVKDGLKPGWLYDLVYTARDPRVSGLGLAGLRDAISFFRHSQTDNPLADSIDRTCIFGISQSGRFIHHFLYEGLNTDEAGEQVFDGAIIHVAGAGKGFFNYRFAMATVYGTQHRGNLSPADFFPFAPMPQTDPITGQSGDSLARLRKSGHVPKIFFVQTSTEYWERAASLLHTDVEGKRDLELDPDVRIYLIAGAAHLGAVPAERGTSQNPRNPLRHRGPVLRALLAAMDNWLTTETEPPASRYPRIDDGTLVSLETFRTQFPKIPSVNLPKAHNQPLRLDPGPRWHTEGIADHAPPKTGKPFVTLVPAVDSDGNDLAGIRLPEIAAPLATFAGWNLRTPEIGAVGALTGLHGSYLPFAKTKQDRGNDSRLSIEERYPDRAAYLEAYADAVLRLQADGFLLERDAVELLREAAARQF
ncbi:MAG: hypothetical protein ACI8UO_004967 [Verrucomicrobiales bacterium]